MLSITSKIRHLTEQADRPVIFARQNLQDLNSSTASSSELPVTAIVIPYTFLPPKNGGHQAGYGLCEALGRKVPTVCISNFDNEAGDYTFQLERAFGEGMTKYFSPAAAWRCYRILKKSRAKYCIAQQPFIVPLLLPLLAILGVQLFVYAHNIEYRRFRSMGKWWWRIVWLVEYVVYRLAAQVLFISSEERMAAIAEFGLDAKRCTDVPYGVDRKKPPTTAERTTARQELAEKHGFSASEHWVLFFGPQNYQPNLEAVLFIAQKLAPLLQEQLQMPYRILICGGALPAEYEKLEAYRQYKLNYLGFVEDIERYVLAADVVLNPIVKGAGVKTKVLEAIALDRTVISSKSGAFGIHAAVCGDKLRIVADDDEVALAKAIIENSEQQDAVTPAAFYNYYYRDAVVKALLPKLQ